TARRDPNHLPPPGGEGGAIAPGEGRAPAKTVPRYPRFKVHETRDDIRQHARTMRHEPTKAERKLWRWLRDRRFGDHKFRRQYPVGRYVLDFYCHDLKLAIELDGSPHEFRAEYD